MSSKFRLLAGAALAAAAVAYAGAADASGVKLGTLACHVSSGWGFVFGSTRDLRCEFHPHSVSPERYRGTINKFGVDIGYTGGGEMIWEVFAPEEGMPRGALAGDYAGATAGAAVGVGLSANALVGGFHRSIALQPVSIEGESGLNVAAGIGSISLHYVGPWGGGPGPDMDHHGPGPDHDEDHDEDHGH